MNTSPAHPATERPPKMSIETARALLDHALEAGKGGQGTETARKRAAKAAEQEFLPIPAGAMAEAESAVPEQELGSCAPGVRSAR